MTNAELEHAALLIIRDHVVTRKGMPTLPVAAAHDAVRRIIRLVRQDLHKPDPHALEWPWKDCVASLHADLIAAGAAEWKGALDADGAVIHVGDRLVLTRALLVSRDYLPIRWEAGLEVRVEALKFFGKAETAEIALVHPHWGGITRDVAPCDMLRRARG